MSISNIRLEVGGAEMFSSSASAVRLRFCTFRTPLLPAVTLGRKGELGLEVSDSGASYDCCGILTHLISGSFSVQVLTKRTMRD